MTVEVISMKALKEKRSITATEGTSSWFSTYWLLNQLADFFM
jgi:hypothetical protein